ncbi:hypothetical protein F4819DRAFT_411346 [Hypoxylon fuscum]|nr:hypothetical protein F4819DRAFT_411346 [Hypoxylon fuscum]
MAATGSTQALLAAFFFGILFNAASAALVLYVIGHGSAIFRDGLRLVLILFLTSSAAWALVEFLATIIEPTAASTCQIVVVFSSVFDQLGRVFVEQYLVWAVRTEGKKIWTVMSQLLIFGRFGVGVAFVGLTRSDFNPTCAPVSSVLPVAVVAIVLDVVIVASAAVQILSTGSTKGVPNRRKSVTLVTIGLAVWIGMSVTLLLGMETTELVFKTTLPALGLAILVALVTMLSGTLVAPRGPPPPRPDSPTTRDISRDRDLSSSDSAGYPPSRYEDVKALNTTVISAYVSGDGGVMNGIGGFQPMEMSGSQKKANKGNAWAKASGGKLVISNPILKEEEGMRNPLNRIPTIDLATAASNEKERRTKIAQRGSALIAQRPAPQPPNGVGEERRIAREASMRRKEVAPSFSSSSELERSVSTKTTKTSGGLSVEANASSTSSELSPGAERIRRRSPRQPPAPPIPATFQPIRPGEPIRIPIPRPREPPQSPKAPEPVKTPLQRRPTIGLPSNPRAQAMRSMTDEAKNQRQETVLFVNNIVYDDPTAVNNIVQGASKTPITALDSAGSVVNRPRPIPRKGDKDRQVFPAELSPHGHKRSKSSGSVASRKSILQSMPGSPTQLPPLPPPPKSAGNAARPLPNDTKSMTFDEKMDFMYPAAPLSAPSTTSNKRRSEVPEIPLVPVAYTKDTQLPVVEGVPGPETNSDRRVSKTTDRSSIRTTSILGIEDIPQRYASRNAVDELGQSWLPGISAENERQNRPSHSKTNRKSSPVIPVESHFSMSSVTKSENRLRDEDASTVWGSVHSPVVPVDVQQARLNARSTYIRKESEQIKQSIPANITSEATMAMLVDDNQEFLHSDEKVLLEIPVFHHRIGEELPAFSTRKDKGRLRKMPPPAPLLLNGRSIKRAIVVQAAEPSPLESPEAAYQMIQAQLQRFDQPNRESVDSQGQRLALLENIEREMGQLENKWQTRLDRDSMSSIQTSPSKDSRPPSIAERRASRRASLRNSAIRSRVETSTGTPSSQSSGTSSENTHASIWQARLAEAQMEYMKSTPDLIMKRNNLNFLSVSKAALGSPSPPDTDESEYENELPASVQFLSPKVYKPVAKAHQLWKQQSPVQLPVGSGLWVGVVREPHVTNEARELPGLSVRPAIRKTLDSLPIESTQLWQKPAEISSTGAVNGLWTKYVPSEHSESSGTTTRPVTMRPPRKNKRVTLLPDILENPEPLPNKRGTLGIFQFPWGEKSEHATIQPQPTRTYMALPGTMTTGGSVLNASLDARSRQLEADEFTTSFFDDYEAEEEGDNFDDFSDSDGEGDDFDENTLWEIASLLKTENLPSKNSLFPLPLVSGSVGSPMPASYVPETLAGDYHDNGIMQEEPIPVDRLSLPTSKHVLSRSQLWTALPQTLESHRAFGLPQPDSATWKRYITETAGVVRSASHFTEISPIQSNQLWDLAIKSIELPNTGLLWNMSKSAYGKTIVSSQTKASAPPKSLLWLRPVSPLASEAIGLFDVNRFRVDYRKTSKAPAALSMTRKPRAMEKCLPLETLTSKALWGRETITNAPSLWKKPIVMLVFESSGLFDSNASRSDYRRTEKEPAAVSMQTAPRTAKEPLTALKTNSLWSKKTLASLPSARGPQLFTPKQSAMPTSRSTKAGANLEAKKVPLWEKPQIRLESNHDGLFDASIPRYNYRRTSKVPASISMSKKSRSSNKPLPTLTTTSLWSGELQEHELPISVSNPLPVPEEIVASTEANFLWERSVLAFSSSDNEGLFDVSTVRVDYRRTSQLPAAINMTRKPRKMRDNLATLTSTTLWETQPKSAPVSVSMVSLWNKPTAFPVVSGLFQLDPNRKVFRTTSTEPAALQMIRRPRLVNEPLPKVESTRLWINSQVTSVELDWITIASVRPRSPSVASVSTASSPPSSPVTDSSSVKTSTTKASSAKSAGGFFSGWFGKKRKESEAPEVPEVPTLKVSSEVSAVLEVPEEFIVKNLDEVPHRKPAHTPIRQQYRPSVAYRANWDNALREAVAESYPATSMVALRASYPRDWMAELQAATKASHIVPKIVRKAASPREWSIALHKAIMASSYPDFRYSRGPLRTVPAQFWDAALQEVIVKSQPTQTTNYDVAVRHPVFMGSLSTTAETIHPAISPRVLRQSGKSKRQLKNSVPQPIDFDVTVRHPVFFGSMETTASIVHPAIEPQKSKRGATREIVSAPLLWAKQRPTKAGPTATEGLWGSAPETLSSSFKAEVDMVVHHNPRKPVSEVVVKLNFSQQGMWKRKVSQSQDRDWLEDSMKKRFTRIELRY